MVSESEWHNVYGGQSTASSDSTFVPAQFRFLFILLVHVKVTVKYNGKIAGNKAKMKF